jgi:superfamily II DNA or RNA helicase
LRACGVVPDDLGGPNVLVQKSRAVESDWDRWRSADVVVGTVNVLSHGFPDVTRIPAGIFDLLIFDEAHHLPATAWTAILEVVPASAALFTATPFRRDQQRLPGEIAFTYSLLDHQSGLLDRHTHAASRRSS